MDIKTVIWGYIKKVIDCFALVDNGGSLVNEVESVGGILCSIFLESLYCFGILL